MKKALLVEDMPIVRKTITKMMSALGCEVVAVENADRALEIIDKGDPYDLLISDVVMPGSMDGHELACAVKNRRADLPVIPITGFSSHFAKLQARSDGAFSLIKKPFSLADLSQTLDLALERASA